MTAFYPNVLSPVKPLVIQKLTALNSGLFFPTATLPIKNLSLLDMTQYWQVVFPPVLPLLADNCQLSIPQLRQILPDIWRIVVYQMFYYQHTKGDEGLVKLLDSLAKDSKNLAMSGFTFANLQQVQPHTHSFRQRFFYEQSHFLMGIGWLAARTQLPIATLQVVVGWVSWLSFYSLSQVRQHTQLSATEMSEWLKIQQDLPTLYKNNIELGLVYALGIKLPFAPSATFCTTHNPTILPKLLISLPQIILTHPLSICPLIPKIKLEQNISQSSHLSTLPSTPPNTTNDIFLPSSPSTPTQWSERLQRHWMAVAAILTGGIFGSVMLLNTTSLPPKSLQNTATGEKDNIPHDVAIMKVETENPTTLPPQKTPTSSPPPTQKNKTAPKQDTQKKDITKKDSVKSSEKPNSTQKNATPKTNSKESNTTKLTKNESKSKP